jgi:hypothetical protein
MTPLFRVNHTFEARVFAVPNPFLAALVQCASRPGAPGATALVACANKADGLSNRIVEIAIDRNMMAFS